LQWQRPESCACQLHVQASKDGHHRATEAEGELDSPSGVDHPRGQVHLDQVVDRSSLLILFVVGLDHDDVLNGVVAAVQTQQQGGAVN
jgi:hypothetical protein